ncbi:alanine dehydrogenase [Desulfitobacterium sp. Sab5]|uniref:alanine dehydrogenase n=1 Tax=Desulfitobacterium nosdiversum TaxID=3375356 RepID=UPI003CEFC13A
MIIGVPKEIKNNENRVALTPAGAKALTEAGHSVLIENDAGSGSGITNEEYVSAGSRIFNSAAEIFNTADMIVKVKEPQPSEYALFRPGQILFTYLHLAPEPELTHALLERKVTGIAYETIQLDNGSLPLLIPMSEVAGRMSVQVGARFLEKHVHGRGILLSGVPGVPAAHVVIIGGGTVGGNAAKIAIGMGAQVTVIDRCADKLRYLDDIFGNRITTMISNSYNIAAAVRNADLLIGAVLVPGAKAPHLVTEEMVKTMQPGAVIVDVAIDQGGSIETIDHVTTHDDPIYEKYGVIHYSVANMPGAVARTSTFALTNATLPYIMEIANQGLKVAMLNDPALAKGLNTFSGHLIYPAVAEALKLDYIPIDKMISKWVAFI